MRPRLVDEDIKRIAEHLGMSGAAFIATYLEDDPKKSGYRMKVTPCPFLADDGRCNIYTHRPVDCREYPHTDKEGFIWRTYLHSGNTLACPAVYRIVKRMRQRRRRLFRP